MKSDETISAPQARAVPKRTAMKAGVGAAALIACMAAMACGAGRRSRAFMMNAENAKKIPATTPQPRAAKNVSNPIKLSISPTFSVLYTM